MSRSGRHFILERVQTANWTEIAATDSEQGAEYHDCLDHLRHREHDWVETHGLECGPYEQCHQEWFECSECGDIFTPEDLTRIYKKLEEKRIS
jgi:hypothetical protein